VQDGFVGYADGFLGVRRILILLRRKVLGMVGRVDVQLGLKIEVGRRGDCTDSVEEKTEDVMARTE